MIPLTKFAVTHTSHWLSDQEAHLNAESHDWSLRLEGSWSDSGLGSESDTEHEKQLLLFIADGSVCVRVCDGKSALSSSFHFCLSLSHSDPHWRWCLNVWRTESEWERRLAAISLDASPSSGFMARSCWAPDRRVRSSSAAASQAAGSSSGSAALEKGLPCLNTQPWVAWTVFIPRHLSCVSPLKMNLKGFYSADL